YFLPRSARQPHVVWRDRSDGMYAASSQCHSISSPVADGGKRTLHVPQPRGLPSLHGGSLSRAALSFASPGSRRGRRSRHAIAPAASASPLGVQVVSLIF